MLSYQNGKVCPEEISDQYGRHDDGVADEGSNGQEVITLRSDVKDMAVLSQATYQKANHDQDLK